MEMSCGFFPPCADEFVNDRLIPLLSLHAVNIVKFPDWFTAIIGQSGVYPRNQCATSLCSGRECLKGKGDSMEISFLGQVYKCMHIEIRSFGKQE